MNKKTIREIAALWKESKRPYVKRSTFAAYLLTLENHILPVFGDSPAPDEASVQAFVLEKLDNGLCVKTVKDILMVLRMVMKFGEKNGWMPHCEWDIKYPVEDTEPVLEVLSVANHKKILNHIREHFSFPMLGVYISLTAGMRIGEVCGLKWNDFDTVSGIMTVGRTVERIYVTDCGPRHTELIVSTPKTKKSYREIPMSRELLSIVKPLKKVFNGNFFVLTNSERPSEPRTLRNHYKRMMEDLHIPKLKYHGLRHSFATRCIEAGCDYKTVSVLLGHSCVSTTLDLYVHPNREQKKRCIDKVARTLYR